MRNLILDAANPINWQHPLNRGLVGWWMSAPGWSGGSRLHDLTGRNHGSPTNMDPVTDWVGREYGPALDFDGTDDYVDTNSPIVSDSDAITCACWARPVNLAAHSINGLVSRGKDGFGSGWNVDLRMGITSATVSSAVFSVVLTSGGTAAVTATASLPSLPMDTWYHFAGSLRPGVGVTVYLNGVSVATQSSTKTTLRSSTVGVRIGGGGTSASMSGQIYSSQMWNRTLSDAEVLHCYRQSVECFPDALRWLRGRSMVSVAAAASGGGPFPWYMDDLAAGMHTLGMGI